MKLLANTLVKTLQDHGFDTQSLVPVEYGGTTPIYQFPIPIAERSHTWVRLRALVGQLGYWPVIVDHRDPISAYQDNDWTGTPATILEEASKQDPLTCLLSMAGQTSYPTAEEIFRQIREEHETLGLTTEKEAQDTVASLLSDQGLWKDSLSVSIDKQLDFALYPEWYSSEWHPLTCNIVLFPTRQWWEIAALIRFYPADPGPDPITHVVLWKWWAQRYGAELIYITCGGFTLRAMAPPATPNEAFCLSWEHCIYCNSDDIFFLSAVERATQIYRGEAWHFGWID